MISLKRKHKGEYQKDKAKNKILKCRADEDDLAMMQYLMDATKMSKSDIIRKGLKIQYQRVRYHDGEGL